MRRILWAAGAVALLSCTDNTLGPVQTVDGQWSGVQNGYSFSFNVVQADTLVSGAGVLASVGGSFQGNVSGTFKYPTLHLLVQVAGFEDANYDGTMSSSEAKIFGKLSGSGLNNVEVDVRKK
ncbi:MAG TPA: hypothetical protein VN706_22730 [Gemmatimonadaceae bacterium]|jgi:hypothetical protein|nr:hypothetical protein [Gemmatimonadaceae bacterium]